MSVVPPVVPVSPVSVVPPVPPVVVPVPSVPVSAPSSGSWPTSWAGSCVSELGFSTTSTAISTVFSPATPLMMALPTSRPVMVPSSLTVATAVLLLLQSMEAAGRPSSISTVASMV